MQPFQVLQEYIMWFKRNQKPLQVLFYKSVTMLMKYLVVVYRSTYTNLLKKWSLLSLSATAKEKPGHSKEEYLKL